jgi:hypothetical protein
MQLLLLGAIMATQVWHANAAGAALYGYKKSDCSDPVSVHQLNPGECTSLGGRGFWNTGDPNGKYYFYDNDLCLTDHLYAGCGVVGPGNTHCQNVHCIASGSGPGGVIYHPA